MSCYAMQKLNWAMISAISVLLSCFCLQSEVFIFSFLSVKKNKNDPWGYNSDKIKNEDMIYFVSIDYDSDSGKEMGQIMAPDLLKMIDILLVAFIFQWYLN